MPPTRNPSALEVVVKALAVVAGAILGIYLLWRVRGLVVPVVVGGLLAYICGPLVAGLERYRITRGQAIGLLLLVFASAALGLASLIRAGAPTEIEVLDLKTRALRKVNDRYLRLMGLDSSPGGNRIYRLVHEDAALVMDRANRLLGMTPEERAKFARSHAGRNGRPTGPADAALLDDDRSNLETLERRGLAAADGERPETPRSEVPSSPGTRERTPLRLLAGILSTWIVAPTVFFFLLRDTGEIKRSFMRLVPNRLFEPTLAVLEDLDRALGSYLRGVFLECCLLALALALLFAVLGIPVLWAVALAVVAGATNVIPYVGSAVALLLGLAYIVLAETVHPLLPMVTAENVALWLVGGILLVELLKNILIEPVVLGSAAKLHPLVVVLGVLGGGILFGLPGVLLAIPTITIVSAFASSASTQLKAYGLA